MKMPKKHFCSGGTYLVIKKRKGGFKTSHTSIFFCTKYQNIFGLQRLVLYFSRKTSTRFKKPYFKKFFLL